MLGAALRAAEHAVVGVHAVSEENPGERAEALLPGVPVLEIPEIVRRSETGAAGGAGRRPGATGSRTGRCRALAAGPDRGAHRRPLGTGILAPARAAGAIPLAIHPAMSFTGMSLDLARLQRLRVRGYADRIVLPIAQALVVEMGAESTVIEEQDRARCHAALRTPPTTWSPVAGQAAQLLASWGSSTGRTGCWVR